MNVVKKSDVETAASGGMDGAEEGPGTGWECNTESTDCNKYEFVVRQCHTVVNIMIEQCCVDRKPIPIKPITYCMSSPVCKAYRGFFDVYITISIVTQNERIKNKPVG